MNITSEFVRIISQYHAPTYYDDISDYKFLYVNGKNYFIIKYHYYNGFASFSTLSIPETSVNDIETYEKQHEDSYCNSTTIEDCYNSVRKYLSPEELEKVGEFRNMRNPEPIQLLLKAYELSGKKLFSD